MKAFLSISFVGLVGALVWVSYNLTRPTEAHRDIISGLKEELELALLEQRRLHEEIAALQAELRGVKTGPNPDSVSTLPPSERGAFSNVSMSSTEGDSGQLGRLKAIYDENLSKLNQEEEDARAKLKSLEIRQQFLANNSPQFAEQSAITDEEGAVIGNRGVRTSDADRAREIGLRKKELDEADAAISEAKRIIEAIPKRRGVLEEQYRKAVEKASAVTAPR